MKKSMVLLTAVLVALVAGCDNKQPAQMPEVNAENCAPDRIQKIGDRQTREQFAGACSRRSVIAPTDTPKNWLEVKP
ncbi:entry exclusion lipoprotein TrbK [Verticiella sediminum]|uniref:Entry exclusion lipoprotein TrbK n=1 Tax=Verticiella sediminum TaxID=1247510 RepID=A0A556ACR9_9BURK|nr:entry exclusion lipoprotein TrbK [Verticiella sediminum]TSH90678.1 entry exclusion lipoprotein TrbK [Verticiella sediminum]